MPGLKIVTPMVAVGLLTAACGTTTAERVTRWAAR